MSSIYDESQREALARSAEFVPTVFEACCRAISASATLASQRCKLRAHQRMGMTFEQAYRAPFYSLDMVSRIISRYIVCFASHALGSDEFGDVQSMVRSARCCRAQSS